ncbi:MAG: GNAT family N-acetyltransferase [Candidatus Woesearchaeota archaeon]|jgi:hypothetical protein
MVSNQYKTEIYSKMNENDKKNAGLFLIKLAANADKRSEFYSKNQQLVEIFCISNATELYGLGFESLDKLLKRNYDFLMLKDHKNRPIGTNAFQKHQDGIHSFLLYVTEEERCKGHGTKLIDDFVTIAYENNIQNVRLGRGTNRIMQKIIGHLPHKNIGFPIELKDEGWIYLPKNTCQEYSNTNHSEELVAAK